MTDARVPSDAADGSDEPSAGDGGPSLKSLGVETQAWIRLCLAAGLGPVGRDRLMAAFGDAATVLHSTTGRLQQVSGIGPKTAQAIIAARDIDLDRLESQCRVAGLRLVVRGDRDYPRRLTEIPAPPGILFISGELSGADELAVAVVGTRRPSRYGERQAHRFAKRLAQAGVTVVSGLALGIDGAAHRGAIEGGGRTVAVLGSGHVRLYPSSHRKLSESVAAHGAVVSEYPPHRPPLSSTFPQRNRIVSGLALATLVIEAGARSGALITARHAVEQNRDVMAIPGSIERPNFSGSHRLLRDGALLVESPEEVLEALGPLPHPVEQDDQVVRTPAEVLLTEQERTILGEIGSQPTPIDQVVARSGLPVHRVLSTLSMLEMRRLVERVSGQFVMRR